MEKQGQTEKFSIARIKLDGTPIDLAISQLEEIKEVIKIINKNTYGMEISLDITIENNSLDISGVLQWIVEFNNFIDNFQYIAEVGVLIIGIFVKSYKGIKRIINKIGHSDDPKVVNVKEVIIDDKLHYQIDILIDDEIQSEIITEQAFKYINNESSIKKTTKLTKESSKAQAEIVHFEKTEDEETYKYITDYKYSSEEIKERIIAKDKIEFEEKGVEIFFYKYSYAKDDFSKALKKGLYKNKYPIKEKNLSFSEELLRGINPKEYDLNKHIDYAKIICDVKGEKWFENGKMEYKIEVTFVHKYERPDKPTSNLEYEE